MTVPFYIPTTFSTSSAACGVVAAFYFIFNFFLIAIFRDLNDFSVFKAYNMAFLLAALSKFLQKPTQVSRLTGWFSLFFVLAIPIDTQ